MQSELIVFVVDDDAQSRKSVCALVRSMKLRAEPFASAEEFLADYQEDQPGCVVTDVRMLGMSGLELQEELTRQNIPLPVVIMTAYARTPLTVRAIRGGAVTVLEKPCHDDELWDAIRKALAQDAASRSEHERRRELRQRIASLTPIERKVLDLVVQGKPNKVIAMELDVSLRTIESRRKDVYEKTRVNSVADLVRLVIDANPEE